MTESEVVAAVERILTDLDPDDFPGEAVNWADLRCVEARQYVGQDPAWSIKIEEADPAAAALCREIENALYQRYRLRADAETEW
jgi:hypothetical protein